MEGKFVWEPKCSREISIGYGDSNALFLIAE